MAILSWREMEGFSCLIWFLFAVETQHQLEKILAHLDGECRGIFAWNYYPFVNFRNRKNRANLISIIYKKKREDTTLRVYFESTLGQSLHGGCSEWMVRFNEEDCVQPAPIISLIYNNWSSNIKKNNRPNELNVAPAVVSGFCNATVTMEPIEAGDVRISVHVRPCLVKKRGPAAVIPRGNAHTGTPGNGHSTSSLLVQEYCPNWKPGTLFASLASSDSNVSTCFVEPLTFSCFAAAARS